MKQSRDIEINDLDEILKIEVKSFGNPYTKNQFIDIINDKTYYKKLIFDDRVIGYITAKKILNEYEICNIAVEESAKRKGVATKLLSNLINENDFEKIHLEVRRSNEKAIKLYEKLGFVVNGVRKNYYKTEDALLMCFGGLNENT